MELSRNKQNFIAMTVVYNELLDFSYGEGQTFRDARDLMSELCECPLNEVPEYIQKVVTYSLNNYGKIVDVFTPKLKKWTWDRLPIIIRAILLTSYAHKQIEVVDKKVIISTAVDLTKKYVEEKQAKFVNAILDEVI